MSDDGSTRAPEKRVGDPAGERPAERAAERYRGERGAEYHRRVHGQQLASDAVYRAKAELARHRYFRHLPPAARVFEYGVGTGHNLAALDAAERSGWDLSETARAASRARGIHVFELLDEVPDGRYDVVVCRHTLEHVPEPAATLTLLAGKLAPGGRLLVVLPVERGRLHQRRLPDDDVHQHLYAWRLGHLTNLLAVCGLEVTAVDYQWYSMQRLLAWMPRRLGIRAYHLAVTAAGFFRRQSEMVVWAERDPHGGGAAR